MHYIDICVNLDNSQFDRDRADVLTRAWDAGLSGLLITATNLTSTRQAIAWCDSPRLLCTAGVHPHDAADVTGDWVDELEALARHPAVRAIGETGLDFNRNYSPPEAQLQVFEAQIALATRLAKPLFVHDRDSAGAVYDLLQRAGELPPTVIHCFTGSAHDLDAFLDAGYYIGITGWVADVARGAELRALVPRIPLERLLLETDAPFLRPHNTPASFMTDNALPGRWKRRNEPALLPWVCAEVAHCYGLDVETIAAATRQNAELLFGFTSVH